MDSRAFRRFRRNKGALAGLVLVIAVTALGIAGPWFAPYDPVEQFTDTLLLDNGLPAGPGVAPGQPQPDGCRHIAERRGSAFRREG